MYREELSYDTPRLHARRRLCVGKEGGRGWTGQNMNVCHNRVAQTLHRKEEEGTNLFANDAYLQMSFHCSGNK